jgi:hypothetical protein
LVPAFLPAVPAPAVATNTYHYAVSTDGLAYHLGIALEQTGGNLATDADCISGPVGTAATCNGFNATGVANGFDGADPIYDVSL